MRGEELIIILFCRLPRNQRFFCFFSEDILGSSLPVYKPNIFYTVYKETPPWLITQPGRCDNIRCNDYTYEVFYTSSPSRILSPDTRDTRY